MQFLCADTCTPIVPIFVSARSARYYAIEFVCACVRAWVPKMAAFYRVTIVLSRRFNYLHKSIKATTINRARSLKKPS